MQSCPWLPEMGTQEMSQVGCDYLSLLAVLWLVPGLTDTAMTAVMPWWAGMDLDSTGGVPLTAVAHWCVGSQQDTPSGISGLEGECQMVPTSLEGIRKVD